MYTMLFASLNGINGNTGLCLYTRNAKSRRTGYVIPHVDAEGDTLGEFAVDADPDVHAEFVVMGKERRVHCGPPLVSRGGDRPARRSIPVVLYPALGVRAKVTIGERSVEYGAQTAGIKSCRVFQTDPSAFVWGKIFVLVRNRLFVPPVNAVSIIKSFP